MTGSPIERREFIRQASVGTAALLTGCVASRQPAPAYRPPTPPNLVFVFADQWRGQAIGYAGDANARTPHLDRMEAQSVNFTQAVSGCSVCSPYRASLITGQYPLTHGVFLNDVTLSDRAVSFAQACNRADYDTAYIGKWHLNGYHRSAFIPRERRQGFEFWKALECTHNYNQSLYYAGDDETPRRWEGYDAIAQTDAACRYMREHPRNRPFALFLSWGPPHDPYHTAPEKYRERVDPQGLELRPNVPAEMEEAARRNLSGYYAHIAALDDCMGTLMETLAELDLEQDTILVFTSDHGDLLHSQGQTNKQQPYEESVLVPLLIRYPAVLGRQGQRLDTPINTPDLMPTLLGLAGIDVPETVEGRDYSPLMRGVPMDTPEAALLLCPSPFGQWHRGRGGREYRGVRTSRYTYVRDLNGPWLLFDNVEDPYQMTNRINDPELETVQEHLEGLLQNMLAERNDAFLPGPEYIRQWAYEVDETGTVAYTN